MEFLLLGGMVLMMSLLNRVNVMKQANEVLSGLQIPIGIVALVVGLSLLAGNGPEGRSIPAGIMGLISGAMMLFNLLKFVPSAEESIDKVSGVLAAFQIPVGIFTVITVLIAMF